MSGYSFLELKKKLKNDYGEFPKIDIAVLGDTSTQFFIQALKASGYDFSLNLNLYESDFDNIDQEIFSKDSSLYSYQPSVIIIWHSVQKLKEKFYKLTDSEKEKFAESYSNYLSEMFGVINSRTNAKIIYLNYIESNDFIFGNYGLKTKSSFIYQVKKINALLMDIACENDSLFLCDISTLANNRGINNVIDNKLYVTSKLSVKLDFLAELALNILKIISTINGQINKCLILDLDNTLWGGVIGDDGIDNIEIGDLGIGLAFTQFQVWIKELVKRGIIIGICSKNSEDVAKQPFLKHPDMVLKLDDISIFVANWNNKADNIEYIKSVLNIGYDSMIFLDDNPFERNFVRQNLPSIKVPELPEDPAEYLSYVSSLNLFETVSYSLNDAKRTQQYQENANRAIFQRSVTSEEDYLSGLNMQASTEINDLSQISRIAQLTQRSNQFNLRTIRYTDFDIKSLMASLNYRIFSFKLNDKFGDYGLISVVIIKISEDKIWFIENWVMSCRVLKRGVEEFIINKICLEARLTGCKELFAEFSPSGKNAIVEKLYSTLGFSELGDNRYKLTIENFEFFKVYINE